MRCARRAVSVFASYKKVASRATEKFEKTRRKNAKGAMAYFIRRAPLVVRQRRILEFIESCSPRDGEISKDEA